MDRLKKAAILARLTQLLRDKGSWCGETHLQKAVFFVQDLLKVPLGYDFILYKHGPFSFDLRDELTACQADELLVLQPQPVPYGPKFAVTEHGERLKKQYPKTFGKYAQRLSFVADALRDMGVTELERLATALYVTVEEKPGTSVERRAQLLHNYKPHIPLRDAKEAVQELDHLAGKAHKVINL